MIQQFFAAQPAMGLSPLSIATQYHLRPCIIIIDKIPH